MDNQDLSKQAHFAAFIHTAIFEAIEESDEFDSKEMTEGDMKALLHAISTIVPKIIWNELVQDKVDNLGWNHIANRLIVEFTTGLESPKDKSEGDTT